MLWWEAAGTRHLLSSVDYRGLTLREKVFAMQQVNQYVGGVCDSSHVADGGGEDQVSAPLLVRR